MAPDIIPTIEGIGIDVMKCKAIVVKTPNTTTDMASIFSLTPPFLKEEKKPGPTCNPIE